MSSIEMSYEEVANNYPVFLPDNSFFEITEIAYGLWE